jgi:hypothetical protein
MVYMMKATGMMCSQRCEGMTIGPETKPQHISSRARLATASEMFQTSLDSWVGETEYGLVTRGIGVICETWSFPSRHGGTGMTAFQMTPAPCQGSD